MTYLYKVSHFIVLEVRLVMYNPKDSYIQEQLKKALRAFKEAYEESTNKQETTEDFCKMLRDNAPIDAWPKMD